MITINVIDDKICGNYGETPFAVEYTKEVYNMMKPSVNIFMLIQLEISF